MRNRLRQSPWKVLAILAALAAVVLLLIPHPVDHSSADLSFVLSPVFFLEAILVLAQLWPPKSTDAVRFPEEPICASLFQRPPPISS